MNKCKCKGWLTSVMAPAHTEGCCKGEIESPHSLPDGAILYFGTESEAPREDQQDAQRAGFKRGLSLCPTAGSQTHSCPRTTCKSLRLLSLVQDKTHLPTNT